MVMVKLDSKAIGELLKSPEMAKLVNDVADRLAKEVAAGGHDVTVRYATTDRTVAKVFTNSYDQVAHGALTKAAAALNLEIKAWNG